MWSSPIHRTPSYGIAKHGGDPWGRNFWTPPQSSLDSFFPAHHRIDEPCFCVLFPHGFFRGAELSRNFDRRQDRSHLGSDPCSTTPMEFCLLICRSKRATLVGKILFIDASERSAEKTELLEPSQGKFSRDTEHMRGAQSGRRHETIKQND